MTKRKWSSFEKWTTGIAVLTLVVGSILIPVFVPEVRVWLHLEKPVSAPPAVTTSEPTIPVVLPSQPATKATPTPTPNVYQRSATKVKGHNNVAGNNVVGSENVVGNNNQVTSPAPVIVGPGSIGITGGTVTNPTVNNFGSTEWHLNDSQKAALGVFADSLPNEAAQFIVVGDIPDRQSQTYASDLFNVLAAHHRVNRRGHILSMEGEFPTGVNVAVHDIGDTNFETAQRIVSAMRGEDIPVGDVSTSSQVRNHEIHIIVGLMPATNH